MRKDTLAPIGVAALAVTCCALLPLLAVAGGVAGFFLWGGVGLVVTGGVAFAVWVFRLRNAQAPLAGRRADE
jgi:hypothetical protein